MIADNSKDSLECNGRLLSSARAIGLLIALLAITSAPLCNQASAASEKILWSFGTGGDGVNPNGGLLMDAAGIFYGTTLIGGVNDVGDPVGTVFKLTPAGVESVLWSFGNGHDGILPLAGIVMDTSGNLYGTTSRGGLYYNPYGPVYFGGTAFELTPSGQETILWNFGNGTDGQYLVEGLLLNTSGNLYGTTLIGGVNGSGTAFELTSAGQETILWNFGNGTDGAGPYSNLITDAAGNFYGTTADGGIYDTPSHTKGGTLFKLAPSAAPAAGNAASYTESILWNFGNGTDGLLPNNVIMDSNGNFFGTTQSGGLYGGGTVFELTADGQESVLWSFGNGTDGQYPLGVTIDATGNLYGATSLGGANTGCYGTGQPNVACGTAFELTPPSAPGGNWTETILWNFGASTKDGYGPSSGLIMDASGNLYGETSAGGTLGLSAGTVYELSNVNPSGQIALSAQHLQFPTTAVGGASSLQLAIRNTGTGQLTGAVATPPAPFGLQGSGSFNLAPHSQTKLTLTFIPKAPTGAHRLAAITSNSAKQSSIQLDLRGLGTAPPSLALK